MAMELESAHASSYFKAWSSCVRKVFRLPLTTHTYLVEGHLACEFTPLRNVLLGNFVSFFQRLQDSPSAEVRMMADISASSAMTVTARSLSFVKELTKLDPREETKHKINKALPVKEVPEEEEWRLGQGFLTSFSS